MKESEEMAAENLQREKAIMRCCENGTFDIPHECRKKQERAASGQAGAGPRYGDIAQKIVQAIYEKKQAIPNTAIVEQILMDSFPVSAPASQPSAGKAENIVDNPKSWIAWKRESERIRYGVVAIVDYLSRFESYESVSHEDIKAKLEELLGEALSAAKGPSAQKGRNLYRP